MYWMVRQAHRAMRSIHSLLTAGSGSKFRDLWIAGEIPPIPARRLPLRLLRCIELPLDNRLSFLLKEPLRSLMSTCAKSTWSLKKWPPTEELAPALSQGNIDFCEPRRSWVSTSMSNWLPLAPEDPRDCRRPWPGSCNVQLWTDTEPSRCYHTHFWRSSFTFNIIFSAK